jgi:hypothetical protein
VTVTVGALRWQRSASAASGGGSHRDVDAAPWGACGGGTWLPRAHRHETARRVDVLHIVLDADATIAAVPAEPTVEADKSSRAVEAHVVLSKAPTHTLAL